MGVKLGLSHEDINTCAEVIWGQDVERSDGRLENIA
jgi:hypothetical protein